MDDYTLSNIIDTKNELCAQLMYTLTPCFIEGLRSIFNEAYCVCVENDELSKYLMTFQNFLNNIPKWSSEIVENEKQRIITSSACNYLEDLISCVYINRLKSLTTTRVGLQQKKINIDIPDLNKFIHKAYINIARKVYVNIYLFEKDIKPLQIQKNNRELEVLIKECILNTIRESIPIEQILRMYLDETQETDVVIEEKKEIVPDKEAIEKNKKEKEKKELEKIKRETQEALKKESKTNLTKSIINANKDLNSENSENSVISSSTSLSNSKTKLTSTTSNLEAKEDSDNENIANSDNQSVISSDYESETESNANYTLKIDTLKDDKIDSELNIQSLDDPNKLDLDILELKSDISEEDDLALDILELQ
jgi:hypothetical protein|uniref:Uncharacterized protein n=1 Tax=viral metagenome TaxID=1070528 RepID=A0A6C0CCW7_9ZZZZ